MKQILFFLLISCSFQTILAQDSFSEIIPLKGQFNNLDNDHFKKEKKKREIKERSLQRKIWLPLSLSALSAVLSIDSTKFKLQTQVRSVVVDTFRTHVDDWIHYTPIVTMYAADLFKVPAKNTVWNQTKFLAISEALNSLVTIGLKYTFKVQRPNNGPFNSYPSGHTSQAFVQSQALFNEFRDTAPLLAASGFLFSITTGSLRVLNNRHWVPDVLLGAGVGILVTNLVWHFEPLKNWNPFNKRKNKDLSLTVVPSIREDFLGGNFRLQF